MIDQPMILDLDNPTSWPEPLLHYLDRHHDLFDGWEYRPGSDPRPRAPAVQYDRAIYGLRDLIQPYFLTGWHCTRLTQREREDILANGMQLPNRALLERRIRELVVVGCLSEKIAARLLAENQADDDNRAGMIWFCFFEPSLAGEDGIGPFFRCWGGEALYNSQEDNRSTGSILRKIGTPCLVEANVPIASLEPNGGLDGKLVRRYLIQRGLKTIEPTDHEDCAKQPISASYIRRIICHPEADFLSLTKSDQWGREMAISPTKWP